jgi:proteasome beta subunit
MVKILETFKTGTTTLGIIAKDSIVLASDMKGTMGYLASNSDVTKIYKINNYLAITIAGGVGDALVLIRHLKVQANLYELEHKRSMNTKSCGTLLSNILNGSKGMPFFTQFILAGWVDVPSMYSMDMGGGMIEEKKYTASGSGTELALSVLDSNYKENITTADAIKLAKDAISAAKKRDVMSGGDGIKIVVIKKDGIEELPIAKYD